nr:immunoglobulin light chain junction region [Macaca mulatta]
DYYCGSYSSGTTWKF